jgi:site-specific recombinase XerD
VSGKRKYSLKGSRHWVEDAVAEAGIRKVPDQRGTEQPFTWHCLRHTFASRLVMKGVDLRTVQELMGQRGIQMTMRYVHLAPEHLKNAVDLLVGEKITA